MLCCGILLVWVSELAVLVKRHCLTLSDRWTSYPSVNIWAPLTSGVLVGWGVCWIFVSIVRELDW